MIDPQTKTEDLAKAEQYLSLSVTYMRPYWETAIRMYKIYELFKDAVDNETEEDADQPNVALPYAFGIVENIVAKSTEPLFQMKPPVKVQAKRVDDEDKADNFTGYARNFFSSSEWQLGYTRSNRECIIAGWAWEKDEWAMQYIMGKRWVLKPKTDLVSTAIQGMNKVLPMQIPVSYEEWVEEDFAYPERVGFHTRFPSIFDVFPEPGVRNMKDAHWIGEQERYVALDDLRNQYYEDPVTGEKIPVYDLSEIDQDYKGHKPGQIIPERHSAIPSEDYGDEIYQALTSVSGSERENGPRGDIDRVHLLHIWEKTRYFCVANGKYVISHREFPFHKPQIPYRLKVYTQQAHTPIGKGALQPVEHMLYLMDDTQSLTLQQWIEITHNMVAVKEDAVMDKDDFMPRAGGRIRIRNTQRVSDAIMSIPRQDSTSSMIAQQSNLKGLIEWADGVSDLSPGTEGTKQYHKTYSGLMEIQQALAARHSVIQRQFLANFQDQMQRMMDFLGQFQFSPTAVLAYDDAGKPSYREVPREEMVPQDGFNFIIESSPGMGDESILRDHAVFIFEKAIAYEDKRLQYQDPTMPKANIAESFRKLLNAMGYYDTSEMLKPVDGQMTPQQKLDLMLAQGVPFPPKLGEDLMGTILLFTQALNDPNVKQMVNTGKVQPGALLAIESHLQAAKMLAAQVIQNPQAVIQAQQLEQAQNSAMVGPMNGQQTGAQA